MVSIVVPAYNPPEALFEQCIESLINQTFQDIEIILVDDGSNSRTKEAIENMKKHDSRIHVIHQDNRGVSAARNNGIALAKGEFIFFSDADDCIDSVWIEKAVRVAERENADVVYGRVVQCSHKPSGHTGKGKWVVIRGGRLEQIRRALLLNRDSFFGKTEKFDIGPCGKLFRRRVLTGNPFPEDIRLSEDQIFNHTVLNKCNVCVVSDSSSYYYIANPQSETHKYIPNAATLTLRALNEIRTFLSKDGSNDREYYYRCMVDIFNAMEFSIIRSGGSEEQLVEGLSKLFDDPKIRGIVDSVDASLGDIFFQIKVLLIQRRKYRLFLKMKQLVSH